MNSVALLVALGLAALWIISLAVHAAAGWFTWLVFAAAMILFLNVALGTGYAKRHLHKTTA